MSGRGVTGTGNEHGAGGRRARAAWLPAAGLALALAGGTGLAAEAQEMTGSPIAIDRAGSGTGDRTGAFDPAAAGMARTGYAASPLPPIADDARPFDMTNPRRHPSPARRAALAMHGDAARLGTTPPAAEPFASGAAAPTVGDGAPGTGAATPGAASGATATPAAPASATPGVASPSPQVAEQQLPARLTEIVSGELARFASRPADQQALAAFYAARAFQPAFIAGDRLSPLGQAARDTFDSAAKEGLDPADYAVPPLPDGAGTALLAETEMRLAATTLTYARHVQSGRFDPKSISRDVDPTPTVPDPAGVLAAVTDAPDARAAFAGFAPQYEQYRRLKQRLAELATKAPAVAHVPIPPGPSLRPGESDPRVPLLRARLDVAPGDNAGIADDTYDSQLVAAVRTFQRLSGLSTDGIVGRGTLAALNDIGADPVADIIANMERWRWLPHAVAPAYVMVNIPEFTVRVVVDERPVHETRVVVGKPETQTPIMSETLQYVVFNPSWHVPPSIIRNEMLPKLRADPYALQRQGIDVVRNGRVIDPGMVDWRRGTQGYAFRQEPGERNALGRMKFMFPNKHAVYLHDTPSRALFARDRRAFSHGCVRVHEPLEFAEVLFSLGLPKEGWSQQRLSRLLGGREKSLPLKQKFPVHLVYFTTFVGDDGRLVTREDLYGINAATKADLGLGGARQFADRRTEAVRR
ncbi:L,D-transpeptidase family protein [Ancylobacter dichloromethanicus]|uniref:L,D-transpeptidase family protein n=1 Tax=Ancylobacter dichloromethanicus TaxID=518825 RepID=UPI00361EBB59